MHHSLKKEKLAIRIAFMISAGFIAQWIMILDMKEKYGAQYISMFDWYILNYSAANLIPNFMIWGIPLLCGLLNGNMFAFYRPAAQYLFVRTPQKPFLLRKRNEVIRNTALDVILFFLSAAGCLFITMKSADPSMAAAVSIPSSRVEFSLAYFSHPFIFISYYVAVICIYNIAFSLCGFLISTYSSNGVLIRCTPFLVMILDSIIATSISGIGTLVNYSDSAQILARSSPLGFAMDSLFRLLIPILLVILLCRVIRKRSDQDIAI